MSRAADLALRVLAAVALVLILVGAYLALGLLLEVTSAEATTPTDAGVRLVVITSDPEPVPASLLRRY